MASPIFLLHCIMMYHIDSNSQAAVFKIFGEFVFLGALLFGMVVTPISTVLADKQPGTVNKESIAITDILDRWVGRAAEYGIIGIVALWLLRVIIVDVKGDIRMVVQLLMKISEQAEAGGNDVKRLCNEINNKMERLTITMDNLLRDMERIEYKCQRGDNDT